MSQVKECYTTIFFTRLYKLTSLKQIGAPNVASSLFAKVLIPDENVIPAWEQPDSTNPYMIGDKVMHNNKYWISIMDANVWEPGVYGWEEYLNV